MPWQITATDATVTFANATLRTVTLLDVNGAATQKIPVTRAVGKLTIKLPANAMYVILE